MYIIGLDLSKSSTGVSLYHANYVRSTPALNQQLPIQTVKDLSLIDTHAINVSNGKTASKKYSAVSSLIMRDVERMIVKALKLAGAYTDPSVDLTNPKIPHVSRSEISEIFQKNGFTIKEGQTDLKPYVFDAAHDLLANAFSKKASNHLSKLTQMQNDSLYSLSTIGKVDSQGSGHVPETVVIAYEYMMFSGSSSPLQFHLQESLLALAEKYAIDCYGFSIGFVKKAARILSGKESLPTAMEKEHMLEAYKHLLNAEGGYRYEPLATNVDKMTNDEVDAVWIGLCGALFAGPSYPLNGLPPVCVQALKNPTKAQHYPDRQVWWNVVRDYFIAGQHNSSAIGSIQRTLYPIDLGLAKASTRLRSAPANLAPNTPNALNYTEYKFRELIKDLTSNEALSQGSTMCINNSIPVLLETLIATSKARAPSATIVGIMRLAFGSCSERKATEIYQAIWDAHNESGFKKYSLAFSKSKGLMFHTI